MAKIDIIIPAYNTEKYLGQCLLSVINQSFKDVHVYVIDDGSIDNTLEVAFKYKNLYPNKITVIANRKNYGVSYSWNIGLSYSDGEYVTFLDSDDTLTDGILEYVNNIIEDNNPDIVTTNMSLELKGINLNMLSMRKNTKVENKLYNPLEEKTHIYEERPNCTAKYFKRELITTEFPENLKWEDYAFTIPYLIKSKSIFKTSKKGYIYRVNPFGTTITDMFNLPSRITDIFDASDMIIDRITEDESDYYHDELRILKTMNCLNRARDLVMTRKVDDEDLKELASLITKLVTIKEGDFRALDYYQYQKEISRFYRYRMNKIESWIDEFKSELTKESDIKRRIILINEKYKR